MSKIIMATNNKGKIDELKKHLVEFEVCSQKEVGISIDVDENGETFEENAVLKVKALEEYVRDGIYIIGEDSGICVEALNGYPGTYTKRAATLEYGREVTEKERYNLILEKLKNAHTNNRNIKWQTVVALMLPNKSIKTFIGVQEGIVSNEILGNEGFGFDPIFFIPEASKTLGQMNFEEKCKYSARRKAVQKLVEYLKSIENS